VRGDDFASLGKEEFDACLVKESFPDFSRNDDGTTASAEDVSWVGAKYVCPLSRVEELLDIFSGAGQAFPGSVSVPKCPPAAAAKFCECSNVFKAADILYVSPVCISDKLSDFFIVGTAPTLLLLSTVACE
jgi:hypothetical protein